MFQAALRNLAWNMKLRFSGDQMQGFVNLRSDIQGLSFDASKDIRPEIMEATNEALGSVKTLDALVALNGTLQKPDIALTSDIGEQIAEGVQTAFYHQLEKARDRLLTEVNEHASEQLEKLKLRFADEYQHLAEDNQKLMAQIRDVQSILVSLQSGKANPVTIARQVSQSSLLSEKDQKKVQRVLNEFDGAMQGQIPQAILRRLPISPDQLPPAPTLTVPGFLPGNLAGLFPGLMAGTIPGAPPLGPVASEPRITSTEFPAPPASPESAPVVMPITLPGLLPGLFPGLMQPMNPQPQTEESAEHAPSRAPLIIPRFRLGGRK